ncbi:MAG: O-antigen ligase family protein [Pelatocladus maniniholoensis HA4357-MV3]|jgi:exopolysaccharide production protein ExoQ|uniref:O-antigen ligase family protein n=1 Tax=Pelatocladus maniniholoensis HA4357-MV3 TaxID=1117104 RepID=A0A9E3LTJ4_9NOST|nr:O-antigen ligase family protein [Pelatocladus maniniholoensis HA4357-MV3]
MKKINIEKYLRFGEKVLIISGLSFFSGIFGTQSMGIVLSEGLITFIRFSLWGIFTFLVFLFWQDAIAIINRNKVLFILTALAYFSFLWSDFPDYTFLNSRDILMMTNFGLYFAIRFSLKEQIKLVTYTLLIGMFLSLVFVYVFPGIGRHWVDHPGAWKGVYGHKNYLGSMMVLSSLAFLSLAKDTLLIYRISGLALSLIFMIFSTSRTSLVISFILILIIMFYKQFRWRGKVSVIYIDIGILILGCVSLLIFTYWVELITGLGRDPTITGRTIIWNVALTRLMERPFLGYGRGAFWAPKSNYAIEASQAIGTGWVPPHGHNGFIDTALDVGLIGLALFLFCYFMTFAKALKLGYASKKAEDIWPLIYLIFLAINNVTESCLLYLPNLYWVLFMTISFTISKTKPITNHREHKDKKQEERRYISCT